MSSYLYGASVQGIQQFIFRTNKLQDIVKASEQINDICTSKFQNYYSAKDDNLVVSAAGNIKCVFTTEERCREAVLDFPKEVMNYAPGITISQAVVEMTGAYADFATAVEELERKLRAQRNKPAKSITLGLMGIERSRQTGLPITDEEEHKDKNKPTMALYNTLFCKPIKCEDAGLDTDDMASENSWIAIIHADGNGLGEIVSRIGTDQEQLHTFSKELDKATITAAQQACEEVIGNDDKAAKAIRPVVLGGDDLTVFCRADKAIAFVNAYLKHFEEETAKMSCFKNHSIPGMDKLTACAGIAFIKSSYPFYYGYNLAETLCGEAKKDAKSAEIKGAGKEVPSCLMFHKVQSSFVENYAEIERKELSPSQGHSFRFGPYYLYGQGDKRWTIEELTSTAENLSEEKNNAAKTDIRQWMTLMKTPNAAHQLVERVKQIAPSKLFNKATEPVSNRNDGKSHYPAYDILTLVTIKNQKTRNTNTTQI